MINQPDKRLKETALRFEKSLKNIQITESLFVSQKSQRNFDDDKIVSEMLMDKALLCANPLQDYGLLWIQTVQRAQNRLRNQVEEFQFSFESSLFYYCHSVFWQTEEKELLDLATEAICILLDDLVLYSTRNPLQLEILASYIFDFLANIARSCFLPKSSLETTFLPIVMKCSPSVMEIALQIHVAAESADSKTIVRSLEKDNPANAAHLAAFFDKEMLSDLALQASEQSNRKEEMKALEAALNRLYL